MITEIATVRVTQGKTAQALEWLGKIAAYIKKVKPNFQVSQLAPTSGALDAEIVLITYCPTLSDWDELERNRREKPDWCKLPPYCSRECRCSVQSAPAFLS